MSDTDKPMTGMALSMLDAPTRGEATLRDLRRYADGIKDDNDRELVQHAADMLDVALRALRPEGRDKERMDWLQSTVHYEPGDDVATIDFTESYLTEAKGDLRKAVDIALQQRAPQEER